MPRWRCSDCGHIFEEEDLPKDCPECDAGYSNIECGCDDCHYPTLVEE